MKTLDLWTGDAERLLTAVGLGPLREMRQLSHGRNNIILVLNEAYVLRIDGLSEHGASRFAGEALAYRMLQPLQIPVPRVLASGRTAGAAPRDYLLMTKVPGDTVKASAASLSEAQQSGLAREFATALAHINTVMLPAFGRLRYLQSTPLSRWVDWTDDFYMRYITRAQAVQAADSTLLAEISDAYAVTRLLIVAANTPRLIHTDAHFDNVMQADGHLTGILDFEWALSGDPSKEFQIEDQWEEVMPGSRAEIYRTYEAICPLTPGHSQRNALYKVLWELDNLVEFRTPPIDPTAEPEYERALKSLRRALAAF